jgi:uncharacterized protein YjbI with pentapeptide repeats
MASTNHLEQLLQGVDAWNAWRQKEPSVDPDLSGANLVGTNLGRANLSRTDLSGAKLMEANLAGANLSGANLGRANLSGANLSAVTTSFGAVDLRGANLSGTDLSAANLHGAELSGADLGGAQLGGANLIGAQLRGANLEAADITAANLSGADLGEAKLGKANLIEANLSGANLNRASLREAKLMWANLSTSHLVGSDLSKANLTGANLSRANLSGADLIEANLSKANLEKVRLGRANLSAANLTATLLVETDLTNADLTGCSVYGISAWRLKLSEGTKQHNLVITPEDEPEVTADDLEVAQFLYLVLQSEKLRTTIDTITSKVVLILGRFPPERKAVLDAVRDRLRQPDLGYVPVVVDFEKPRSHTTVETVMMLARMARFVIADLSDAKSMLQELQLIVASNPMLPVQPLTIAAQQEPGLFDLLERFPSVLRTYRSDDLAQLTADFDTLVVACRLKSWSLQRHSHEALRPDIGRPDRAFAGIPSQE